MLYNGNNTANFREYPDNAAFDVTTLSVACFFRPNSKPTTFFSVVSRGDNASANQWSLGGENANPSDQFRASGRTSTGTLFSAIDPSTYTNGVLYHLGMTWDGSNLRLWVNGVNVATTACTETFGAGADNIRLFERVTTAALSDGYVGEYAMWNTGSLVAADWLALASGVSPLLIKRANLVMYDPCRELATVCELLKIGTDSGTLTVQAHPTMRTRRPQQIFPRSSSALTGSLAVTSSGGTAAMAGTTNVAGALAVDASGATVAMPGTSVVHGEIGITSSGATVAIQGGTPAEGDIAVTSSGGTPAMEGGPIASGDIAVTSSGGTPAMAGTSTVSGTLGVTSSGASVAMQGETVPLATGDLAALASGATVAMAGTSTVGGALAVTSSSGTPAMAGTSDVPGALAVPSSGATVLLDGSGTAGDLGITSSGASVAMVGGPVASGEIGITSSGGAAAMAGTSNVPGALAVTSSGGTPALAGTTNVTGTLGITSSGATVQIREAAAGSDQDEWHPDYPADGQIWEPDYYGEP